MGGVVVGSGLRIMGGDCCCLLLSVRVTRTLYYVPGIAHERQWSITQRRKSAVRGSLNTSRSKTCQQIAIAADADAEAEQQQLFPCYELRPTNHTPQADHNTTVQTVELSSRHRRHSSTAAPSFSDALLIY